MRYKNWYVVQAKPNQEEKVIFSLAPKGIRRYFPKIKKFETKPVLTVVWS